MNIKKKNKRTHLIERYEELEGLHMAAGLPFTKWSKEDQIEYNVLHEILFKGGRKFEKVIPAHGVQYSEAEIQAERDKYHPFCYTERTTNDDTTKR